MIGNGRGMLRKRTLHERWIAFPWVKENVKLLRWRMAEL